MNCYRCQTPLPDEARFCISCGADLSDPSGAGASTTAAMDAARAEELRRLLQEDVGAEFRVERELGRGGMAVVYLATEINLDRKVAIKVLPPDLTFGAGAIERFKREARTAATLDHPNIIPIYRISTGGRLFWYAMKYLEGKSLAEILKERKRLSLSDTLKVLEQVADALDYAHARNVIHRDIKPANVMLDAQKRVVVTDFGIAKQLAAGSFTASGSVLGTPYYMSPEQCAGSKTITGAADQYAVGVMAYEMLAGQVPFEGDSAIDILTKHVMQPPPPLDVLRPGLPDHVYRAVERALAKKPEERFPTVKAFVEAMRAPAEATVVVPKRRSLWREAPTTPVKVRRGKPWARTLAVVAVAGGALGGAALWVLNRGMPFEGRSLSSLAAKDTAPLAAAPDVEQPAPPRSTVAGESGGTPARAQVSGLAEGGAAKGTAQSGASDTAARRAEVARTGAQDAAPSQPRTGKVTLEGVPPGGIVYIDGQRRRGTSFELPAGTYTLRIEAPGYAAYQTALAVRAGGLSRVVVTPVRDVQAEQPGPTPAAGAAVPPTERWEPPPATPRSGTLVVRTAGGWARIYVDGVFKREGTGYREEIQPGEHRVRFERDGYQTVDTTVTVPPGETVTLAVTLRPAEAARSDRAVLIVNAVGAWARVYIDGQLKGQGTAFRDTLAPGPHTIRLEREGYATVDTTVTLAPGQSQVISITMRRSGS